MHYYGWHLACQTYALNLIDSHSGQKQAPQLFSSSKSFRVAKSTPSSTKLSPISKWLLRPPLLFKPRLLFKPTLLSKSVLLFAPLLLLSYTQDTEALTAYTSRTIEGSASYLTFDGEVTKLTNTDSLLSIKLQDGMVYTRSTNPSTPTNPIRLPNARASFNDIKTIVPPTQNSITINDLVSQGNWINDGDGQVTASGNISVTFKDKNGNTVDRSDTLSICKAPYKVTLTSTSGTLSTQYGVPRSGSFSGDSVDYYINPYENAGICSVRPNLLLGGTSGIDYRDNPRFAGPSNIWDPAKGFLTQSTSPSSYGQNFPTTGADGLYFDLDVGGLDASQLSWIVNTRGSITATVSWTRPRIGTFTSPDNYTIQADRWFSDKIKNVTRVTLHGPKASSGQIDSSRPSSLTRPSLPQAFELVGRDRSGNEVKYGFVLKQWLVNRGNVDKSYRKQLAWCNSLGYRMPRLRDLTNAVCSGWNSGSWCQGAAGATPSSSDNTYKRHIDAGFFTEWGDMNDYADAGFVNSNYYWTSDATGSNHPFVVDSAGGYVSSGSASISSYAVCTTP